MSVRGLICHLFKVLLLLLLVEGASSSCSSTWLRGAQGNVRRWAKKENTVRRTAILREN